MLACPAAAGAVGAGGAAAWTPTPLNELWMIAPPMLPNMNNKIKATTPDVTPPVTFSTPSPYFQSHHQFTNGIIRNQAVGMLAPARFISFFVLTSQYKL
jgi:hypothetical protein